MHSAERSTIRHATSAAPQDWMPVQQSSAKIRPLDVYSLDFVPYNDAWNLQRMLVEKRKRNEFVDTLLLMEHPPVITMGRNARPENLLSTPQELQQAGIEVVESDRGGDVTFHGPGQLIGYPILNLGNIRRDVVWYVRTLEEAIIRTAQDCGVAAVRIPGCPGVWVNNAKVASLGIHISRWVTSHGFALNLSNDLNFFRHIIPCGIAACPVTSFQQCLGKPLDRMEVEKHLVQHLANLLGLEVCWPSVVGLEKGELWQRKY